MKRSCNLDLRLSQPPSTGVIQHDFSRQQLTIFYDGRICVCDVAELQARAIIWLASKQMDQERYKRRSNPDANGSDSRDSLEPICSASTLQSQLRSPASSPSGLSMKKSLQRFLQKRKDRRLATSPFHNGNC